VTVSSILLSSTMYFSCNCSLFPLSGLYIFHHLVSQMVVFHLYFLWSRRNSFSKQSDLNTCPCIMCVLDHLIDKVIWKYVNMCIIEHQFQLQSYLHVHILKAFAPNHKTCVPLSHVARLMDPLWQQQSVHTSHYLTHCSTYTGLRHMVHVTHWMV
jgi:accessory gene regulator protein AgrB